MAGCRCTKSDARMGMQYPPFLEDVANRMQDRRCDLLCRQRYLSDKIMAMERSIPALMAYNMWMSDNTCDSAPYCKLQEMMKKFSPYTDPTEKLLSNLKKSAEDLHGETAELHEKIITTEVELEETDMQIESVELANKEMDTALAKLEKEVRSYRSPSLHSIHSEDLTYLTKLRELAKEELNLKRNIQDLETKETIFNEQIDRLLTAKEFQGPCGSNRGSCCSPDCSALGKSSPRVSSPSRMSSPPHGPTRKIVNSPQKRTQVKPEDSKTKRGSWIMNWWSNSKETTQAESKTAVEPGPGQTNDSKQQDDENPCICHSLVLSSKKKKPATAHKQNHYAQCVPLNVRNASGRKLCACDLALMDEADSKKFFSRQKTPPCDVPCDVPPCFGRRQPRDMRNPCNIRMPNETCKPYCRTAAAQSRSGTCRCNCKGKCAFGLADVPCNCSSSCPADKGYRPKPVPIVDKLAAQILENGDDTCDCYPSCDCESSEASSCPCN